MIVNFDTDIFIIRIRINNLKIFALYTNQDIREIISISNLRYNTKEFVLKFKKMW